LFLLLLLIFFFCPFFNCFDWFMYFFCSFTDFFGFFFFRCIVDFYLVSVLQIVWCPYPMSAADGRPRSVQRRRPFSGAESLSFFQDFDFYTERGFDETVEESTKTLALFDIFNRYEVIFQTFLWITVCIVYIVNIC